MQSGERAQELSRTIRVGRRSPGGRTVNWGSSASTVAMPTTMASMRPRRAWTSLRESSDEIHRLSPETTAVLPSRVIAHLAMTRPAWSPGVSSTGRWESAGRARPGGRPRRGRRPPPVPPDRPRPTCGKRIAHGGHHLGDPGPEDAGIGARGCLAVMTARSSVTREGRTDLRRLRPGLRATTSACGPPKRSWWPTAIARPSRTSAAANLGTRLDGPCPCAASACGHHASVGVLTARRASGLTCLPC